MSTKKKIVLVVAVVLIISLGVGFYFYSRKKQVAATGSVAPATAGTTPYVAPATSSVSPQQSLMPTPEQQVIALYKELFNVAPPAYKLAWGIDIILTQGYESLRSFMYANRHTPENFTV